MRSISAFAASACTGPALRAQNSFLCRAVSSRVVAGTPVATRASTLPRKLSTTPRMDIDYADEPEGDDGGRDRAPVQGATEELKLFVGNLSWDTTDHSLGDAFSQYGTVVEARVVTDRFTGKSRGFGFVEYETSDSADDALDGMQGYEVDGRKIRVDRANKRAPRPRREQY